MPSADDFLQFSFIIPAGITIAGWFVVAKQADRREFRKEVRDQIKELRESIDEVRIRAAAYWLSRNNKTAAAAATALASEVKRLGRYARNVEAAGLNLDSTTLMVDVRSIATGGNFQSKSRVRTQDDEERLDDLAGVLEDLMSAADAAFYEEFHPKRTNRRWRFIPLLAAMLLTRDSS